MKLPKVFIFFYIMFNEENKKLEVIIKNNNVWEILYDLFLQFFYFLAK